MRRRGGWRCAALAFVAISAGCRPGAVPPDMDVDGCYASNGFDVAELRGEQLIHPSTGDTLAAAVRNDEGPASTIDLDRTIEVAEVDGRPALRTVSGRSMFLPLTMRDGRPVILVPVGGENNPPALLAQRISGPCR